MRNLALISCFAGLVLSACASSTAAKPEVASGQGPTEFQKRRLLGHYSTEDGKSGFILDRTKEVWRARLDGEQQSCALTASGGPYNSKEYRCKDPKSIWLRVDAASGDVQLFQGPNQTEGVRVVRDADAQPL